MTAPKAGADPEPSQGPGWTTPPTPADVAAAARQAHECGLSVVPPREDGSKAPDGPWRIYQERPATELELRSWYGPGTRQGLGLICGPVSRHLECLEFDQQGAAWPAFQQAAPRLGCGALLARLIQGYCEETPSQGIHLLYFCPAVGPSQKLASTAAGGVLIETRGTGGYVIVAPSSGSVHPSGRPYRLRCGGFASIPEISCDERLALFYLARSLDQSPEPARREPEGPAGPSPAAPRPAVGDGATPWDIFNTGHTWRELLPDWTWVYETDQTWYLRRPGKAEGISATLNHGGTDRLYVFSTSTPFAARQSYSKFGAYVQLHHHGDLQAALLTLKGTEVCPGSGPPAPAPGPPPAARNGRHQPAAAAPRPRVKLTRASAVICLPLEWVWEQRIPRAMITLWAGQLKIGKSMCLAAVAAAISRGIPLPGEAHSCGPADVIMLSAEEDPARIIVPRLKAAGADLSRIYLVEAVYTADGSEAFPSLKLDLDWLEEAVRMVPNCVLVTLDTVPDYIGGIDDHKNVEVRRVLGPLKAMTERLNIATLAITHMNKGLGIDGKARVLGSIGYVGIARANALFCRDPADASGQRILMLDNGGNLGPLAPTLAFTVAQGDDGPIVAWSVEPVTTSLEEALADATVRPDERAEKHACDAWLRDQLADRDVPQKDLAATGRDEGFSIDQLKRSKARIGARTRRIGFGKHSQCFWTLHPERAPLEGEEPG